MRCKHSSGAISKGRAHVLSRDTQTHTRQTKHGVETYQVTTVKHSLIFEHGTERGANLGHTLLLCC